MMVNGYNFKRSGQIQIVLNPGWFGSESKTGTSHGTWSPNDTHIPLLWYGWNIKHGTSNREMYHVRYCPNTCRTVTYANAKRMYWKSD